MQSAYVFREEPKPKFGLRAGMLFALFLLLLTFWLAAKTPVYLFSLSPEELAALQAKEAEEQDMVFRFLDAPEDPEEPKPESVFSNANRQRKAPELAPELDRDPKSVGNTYELSQNPPPSPAQKEEIQLSPEEQEQPPDPVAEAKPEPAEEPKTNAPLFARDGPQPYRKPTESEIEASKKEAEATMKSNLFKPNLAPSRDPRAYDNPEGGGADRLGFSIDTAGHDLGPYLKLLVQLVRANWRIPGIATLNANGIVVVSFNLHKDGRITDTTIMRNSDYEPLDTSAFNAINTVYQAPPLPDNIKEESIPIKFAFYYNVRPPAR
ncbi:MAG: TonB family protein [Acidobacteria bacterium]|nr:TonB family protein [Acidobacteriota bacterium]